MKYHLFKHLQGDFHETLLFSEEREVKHDVLISHINVLSLAFENRVKHFYSNGYELFRQFEEEENFISFLVDRGASHVVINVEKCSENTIITSSGEELEIVFEWISTGYEYNLVNRTNSNVVASLFVPKEHRKSKFDLLPADRTSKIIFERSGEDKDPEIARWLKKYSNKFTLAGCALTSIIICLIILLAYFFLT